ncbi:uncharacterized protein CCDC197 [Notechis scutatus]|uniref:Uncharacterized protein CCDC197 n=1 Tax=Notechis scutatus TaxID=8663 RepID=A0A6J1UVD7_9SAUR|nr:uncharacterized protein CCDC197 [Notechis scutatus]
MREEDSEHVIHVPIPASSNFLYPSRKTLQQLRLLKKKAKNDIITADLAAKKQDIEMRIERVAQYREELQQKDQNHRTQAYGFQIYLQDCDLKKEHALAKYKIEQTNNALKKQEIHTLKRELQKLKVRQQELQKKIDKYKSYEHFLKKIVNLLPPDFLEHKEDSVIKTLTQRHKALFSTNQNLKKRLFIQEENIEISHHKRAVTQEEHNTMRFVMLPIPDHVLISKVSELQSKYNALKERNIGLINYIDNKEGLRSKRTRQLSQMLVGISNMAERCYMKHYGPLEEMTFQSKLDMIQEFIYEKTEMKKEIMKPEGYKSSSRLLKI